MNRETLLKLKQNPFYQMSVDQLRQLAELEEDEFHEDSKPMVVIGVPPVNKNVFKKHDVRVARRKR